MSRNVIQLMDKDGNIYDIKDNQSRADIEILQTSINGGIAEVSTEISLTSFNTDNFRIMPSNGYWAATTGAGGYYMEIPSGVIKVSIKGNASYTSYYAFLSSYSPSNAAKAPILNTGGIPTTITLGEISTSDVPSTATHIFISKIDGSGHNLDPQTISFIKNEQILGVVRDMEEFEKGVSTTQSANYYQNYIEDFSKGSYWRLKLTDTNASTVEIKGLVDSTVNTNGEVQVILNKDEDVLWSPLKDYEAIRYGVNGTCKLVVNDCSSIYDRIERKIFYCGESREYTKLIDAIKAAERYMGSILYVDDGTYDLISEFGTSFFSSYGSGSTPGIILKNRIHIIFSPNSYVICHYEGDNTYVLQNFSPFNCGQYGFILENLNLSSSRVRYGIHDERNGKTEFCQSKYINCRITHDNTNNEAWTSHSCIGGGLGSNHEVIIENCIFDSIVASGTVATSTVYYHPSSDSNNSSFAAKLVVKDNYFETGTLMLDGSRSDASIDTIVIFTNNSIPTINANSASGIYYSGSQSYQGTHYIVRAWNNEIRT